MDWLKRILSWLSKEQEQLCLHCGYYCTGKSIYCLTPKPQLTPDEWQEQEDLLYGGQR